MYKIRYQCSNPSCSFKIALWCKVPVWNEDTPENLRKVPVGLINEKYVKGFYSEEFCVRCGKVVEVLEKEKACPECGGGQFLQTGDACPKCKTGKLAENEDFRVAI